MLKVLQVFGGLDCGGAETMLMNIYQAINRNEVQFDFIKHMVNKGFYETQIVEMGGAIHKCPKYKVYNHFAYKCWWKEFFKSHPEYKIIHSHVRSTASIILKIAKKFGLTTISHSHSTSNGKGVKALIKKFLQRNIVKYSDYCFGCSKKSGEWLFGKGVVETEKFKVVPNAIDVNKYRFNELKRQELKKELGLEGTFVVGHVGRFSSMKNHLFLLDVFNELVKVKENARLLLIGDGEMRAEIENKISELNLKDKVVLLGVRSDIFDLLNVMDCFVFPSIWEGLPVSLVEAQANGLPVIMSDTITDEIKITNSLEEIGLCENIDVWVGKIVNSKRSNCDNDIEKVINAGYDIHESASELLEFYLEKSFSVLESE